MHNLLDPGVLVLIKRDIEGGIISYKGNQISLILAIARRYKTIRAITFQVIETQPTQQLGDWEIVDPYGYIDPVPGLSKDEELEYILTRAFKHAGFKFRMIHGTSTELPYLVMYW